MPPSIGGRLPSDDRMARGTRGRFYRPVKQQVRARLDAVVLARLKSQGKGTQSRMNAILRRHAGGDAVEPG